MDWHFWKKKDSTTPTPTESETWRWPGRTVLTARISQAGVTPDRTVLLVDFLCRLEKKRTDASVGASSSHWVLRASSGLSAAVATLSGGSLLGEVHGRPAVTLGIASAAVGVISAGIVAARPDTSYAANQTAKAAYEKLYWDVSTFALTKAKDLSIEDFTTQLQGFTTQFQTTMAQAPATPPNK